MVSSAEIEFGVGGNVDVSQLGNTLISGVGVSAWSVSGRTVGRICEYGVGKISAVGFIKHLHKLILDLRSR